MCRGRLLAVRCELWRRIYFRHYEIVATRISQKSKETRSEYRNTVRCRNIGRGFMGQLFFEAGYRTVFVEKNQELVGLIRERAQYPLRLLDAYTKTELNVWISSVDSLSTVDGGLVVSCFSEADIAGTAVGVENLKLIAPLIASGIRARQAAGRLAIDIYLCENSLTAAATLKKEVFTCLDPATQQWAENNVGFVGTSVARMVPAPQERFKGIDPLFVVADSYHKLPYDSRAARAPQPRIVGMKPVRNFKAEVERKLFTHNLGHAALGYIGYLKGYSYVHEPFDDPYLSKIFMGALQETASALVKMYPEDLDPREHQDILDDVRVRFSNPMLMDTVQRVARDPLRKLGPNDRLIGSAKLCMAQGVVPANIATICGAALCYDCPQDAAAIELKQLILEQGPEHALRQISGVNPEDELGRKILAAYRELLHLRDKWRTIPSFTLEPKEAQ